MKRDIIEIRNNITNTVIRLEQIEKEKAEREKAEREAKYEEERKKREKEEAEWKVKHRVLDKYTYISPWNYNTYSWIGDYINLRFYEWSNIHSEPKFFSHSTAFFRFLDDCGIMPAEDDVKLFKQFTGCHAVCKPGCSEIIIKRTYEEMKEEFERVSTLAKVLATVPDIDDAS